MICGNLCGDIETDLLLLKTARGGKVSLHCALDARAVSGARRLPLRLSKAVRHVQELVGCGVPSAWRGRWVIPRMRGQGG